MKYWLTGALTLLMASSAWAENYNIVSSRSKKLDVWIDNVKSQNAADWCARQLPLRIVAKGDKTPAVLEEFLPQVGALMQSQCGKLTTLSWQMEDANGKALAKGGAEKANDWQVNVTPPEPTAATAISLEDLSPPADTTPWLQFSLLDGCHFRTWWNDDNRTGALFVPAKQGVKCAEDGWLNGQAQITRVDHDAAKNIAVTFLQGFPIIGLAAKSDKRGLQMTTVNNERMVLADERSPQSWLILPWSNDLNGWQATGTVAVQMSQAEASDEGALKARLSEVDKVWAPYLSDAPLTILLVAELYPQLKDPAAGAWRAIK
ncbi:hypothetical protein COO59_19150 [Mixta theicola]|uniref:Type VI secretion system-associated protein n=1 Tax=Mixta theicola TaxID=1458355 RepID=A0A2K1Q502_9GAMM|nr:hypothetical protein [Mixta theicola]PNS10106.1 hypothetical protein COO59_19150 [Mixta theicola]GLR08542.1 hypothetical protein GCM10007905_12610 [Mixta theicola]